MNALSKYIKSILRGRRKPILVVLWRLEQTDLCEFEANQSYQRGGLGVEKKLKLYTHEYVLLR